MWIGGLVDNLSCFYDILDTILNIWHWIRTSGNTNSSILLKLLFWLNCLFYCNMWRASRLFQLLKKLKRIFVVYSFCCFPCSWISFPCIHLDNNCLIECSAKSSMFYDRLNSCFKLMPASLNKSKWKVLGSVVITSLLFRIITMIWLNCFKVIWQFYCVDTKDIIFARFRFLVCLNYFQLLFVLVVLEV